MLIKEKPLQHWMDHFYGYGSWDAQIWFVAYEESGGGDLPEEVAARLDYFYDHHGSVTTPALCDIRDLYKHVAVDLEGNRANLFSTLFDFRFGPGAIIHGIWKNLIGFTHGYNSENLPDLLAYQKSTFATANSREALINLYPLPSPHNHAWYYSWLEIPGFKFLRRRSEYEEHVYPHRIRRILLNVLKYKPEVVLMYDMSNINVLKASVLEIFPEAKFTMVKGIPRVTPQHHYTRIGNTRLLITTQTPALKHNRIETGFDWYELGKKLNDAT
jgi:hypothetical protein